jgi:adenylate cyclase class 2
VKPEIEVKFAKVDHDVLRAKLRDIGAICQQPMRLMKRRTYDFPDNRLSNERNGWARIRDEGDKITMSYKQLNDRSLEGTHEVNLVVDSFAAAHEFLLALGLESKSYQETKRESWQLDGFEIELDEWPWLAPYIEIEGPSEGSLKTLCGQLKLDWAAALHGSVEIMYQQEYDVTDDAIDAIERITFDDPVPELLRQGKLQ